MRTDRVHHLRLAWLTGCQVSSNADFRRLWIGDGISKLGGSVVVLAVPVLAATGLGASTWEPIRTREPRPAAGPDRNLAREIREGLRYVLGQPFIRATTFHATTAVLFLATRYAIEVLFLLRTVRLAPGGIEVLMTVAGLGAVSGAVLANRIARAIGQVRSVLVSGLAMGLSGLLLPLTGPGWGCSGTRPEPAFLAWATLPLGGLLGGALGTALGLRTTLWLAAAGLLAAALWLVLAPACRVRDLPGVTPAAPADGRVPV